MAKSTTDRYLENNKRYAGGQAEHKPTYPGKLPINPSGRPCPRRATVEDPKFTE